MTSQEDSKAQVKIQFTTRQEDVALPENTGLIFVSTNLGRYALSTLVNHLLETGHRIPFEFLINGEFLRTTINEYLTANGISSETLLTIEYVRAIVPPSYVTSFEHDDWVGAVDVLSKTSRAAQWAGGEVQSQATGQGRILSASFDGHLRVWNLSSEVIATSPDSGHDIGMTKSLKAAKFMTPTQIVAGGYDRTVTVWNYEEDDQMKGKLTPKLELYGHRGFINALDVHAPSSQILSASDDQTVGLWSSKKTGAPAAPPTLLPQSAGAKKRKLGTSIPQRGPWLQLKGHDGRVSGVVFAPNDPTVAYSASWDHTLRTWDLATGACVNTRTTSHPLSSVEALPDVNLVAVGTTARHITLVDPREAAISVSAMTLRGHTGAIASLARDPESKHGLVSGSHDGTCQVWDIRSTRNDSDGVVSESIHKLVRKSVQGAKRPSGDGIKVLGVVWDKEIGIVSGSEDKRVQIDRGSSTIPK